MNTNIHLNTMMSNELADLFMSEIIKSLNEITFNGERKVTDVRKYGNSLAVTIEPFKTLKKEVYSFSLASKQQPLI